MRHYLVGATIFLACGLAAAQDTGDDFAERFAIGEERSALLKELVPGAPDYYYYHCLHLQNEGRLDEVAPLVEQWMKRHVTRDQPEPALLQRIVTRQALLEYSRNNRGSLDFLIKRLNLGFNHQRQLPDAQRRLPSALDEQLISRETLTRQALEQEVNLKQISANGLPRLVGRQLTALQRRDLLERLTRADVPGLVQVIADELAAKDGKAFGSLPIHKHLTMAQLEELETLRPQLLNESRFVGAVVARLVPPEGVDWNRNAEAREQHLDRLWAFATRLKPTFNSLKVHVLYHRLAHDRDLGRYDAASFEQYISLPRRAPYVRPEFLELPKHKGCVASLDSQFNTGLAAVADDAPLVQDYLHHLLARAESYGPYEQFIQSDYLRVRFAEAKLLAGEGDAERWYSMLTPSAVQELQQRVELTLAPTNKFYFEPDEDVALELDIKNIRTLIVRVYEINTLGYYQAMWQQLPADLNVDGLLPNHEMIFNFEEPPLRRVRFKCDLPQLKERGCYIVDFIGNGRSTRAVIRKGSIRFIQKPVADGHEFTLLDENGDLIRDGAILLGRQQLLPDAEGRIMVPPAEEDRHEQIILARGDFATLSSFARGGTACTLDARFYVEREALLPGQLATVMIQARLKRGLAPVPVKLLKDVVLTITASDQQLISTSTEVHDIMLSDDAMATHTFRVPEGLRTIQFKLSGKLQNDLSGREQQLSASFSQKVNHFDSTNLPASLRLVHAEGQYALDYLGRSGEPLAGRAVGLALQHAEFVEPVQVALRTDEAGRVRLGRLADITSLSAEVGGYQWQWPLRQVQLLHNWPQDLCVAAGEKIRLPYTQVDDDPLKRHDISLLEQRANTTVTTDCFESMTIRDGLLEIASLPIGRYTLTVHQTRQSINIAVVEGQRRQGYIVTAQQVVVDPLQAEPLAIAAAEVAADGLHLRLVGAGPDCHVHVAVTRYEPPKDLYDTFSINRLSPSVRHFSAPTSTYLNSIEISQEQRYILDRRYAAKFAGNMLSRPSLLLQPWDTAEALSHGDTRGSLVEMFGSSFGGGAGGSFFGVGARDRDADRLVDSGGLEFMSQPAVLLANLKADAEGRVFVPRQQLGHGQQIRILAIDGDRVSWRQVTTRESPLGVRNLALARHLDPDLHLSLRKQIKVLSAGDVLKLPAAESASVQYELYDSLAKVYQLLAGLSGGGELEEFAFILLWPELDEKARLELYSRYACHELNFFLMHKDRDFFERVIRPHLAAKKDKTFMDLWLLGEDLGGWLQPWEFSRLNIVERCLLGRALEQQRPGIVRHVRELWEMIPDDPQRRDLLFNTALKSQALSVSTDAKVAAKDATVGQEQVVTAEKQSVSMGLDEGYSPRPVKQLYRPLEVTREWAENNYYKLPIERQEASLVVANGFWRDYAEHLGRMEPFVSANLAEATSSRTEMILALAVLDLPFKSPEHRVQKQEESIEITAAGPLVAIYAAILPSEVNADRLPPTRPSVLISQNFFRQDDRYVYDGNQRVEKYVTSDFQTHVVYGLQVVVSNVTPAQQQLNLLMQVPQGAIAVEGQRQLESERLDIEPGRTAVRTLMFYFPRSGEFGHYPAQVASGSRHLFAAEAVRLNVVDSPPQAAEMSWHDYAHNATPAQLLAYLDKANLNRLDLEQMAWRMADRNFFLQTVKLLESRRHYDNTIWSYGLLHNVPEAARQFLAHQPTLVQTSGPYLDSPLMSIDPLLRRSYQHLEYSPLVNARAHRVGRRWQMRNEKLSLQYSRLMEVLSCRPKLDDNDLMSIVYYLLLQDRIEEAQRFFARIDARSLPTRLQYDYMQVYLAFFGDEAVKMRPIAERYAEYPVERWRNMFRAALAQLDEIEGRPAADPIDPTDRAQAHQALAAASPWFEMRLEGQNVKLQYESLSQLQVSYYLMDIELLFSRSPFGMDNARQFGFVRPALSQTLDLPADGKTHQFALPERFRSGNVLVEVSDGSQTRTAPYYSTALKVQLFENYGQIKVTGSEDGQARPKVYVKVYSLDKEGKENFYKDGYTDLRGRFDYSSLGGDTERAATRFAVLVLSESEGGQVLKVDAPKR